MQRVETGGVGGVGGVADGWPALPQARRRGGYDARHLTPGTMLPADRADRAPIVTADAAHAVSGGPVTTTQTDASPEMMTLTDSATAKVAELLEQEGNPELALRVAVRPGGCSGFSYEMFFDSDLADDDVSLSFGTVRVVVDPASASLLQGATLDFKDGLQGAGFSINNPNASRTCGCGNSFS
jgi:iron-sulfur cluster assembly accessory protein